MQSEMLQGQTDFMNNDNPNRVIFELLPETYDQPVPDGPCINRLDRAFHLLTALDGFTNSSKIVGYHTITKQNEKGNDRKICNLQKSAKDYEHEGRLAFLYANNLDPYADNSIKKKLLIAKTVIMAYEFKEEYTGPGTEDKRRELRNNLYKQVEVLYALELGI